MKHFRPALLTQKYRPDEFVCDALETQATYASTLKRKTIYSVERVPTRKNFLTTCRHSLPRSLPLSTGA